MVRTQIESPGRGRDDFCLGPSKDTHAYKFLDQAIDIRHGSVRKSAYKIPAREGFSADDPLHRLFPAGRDGNRTARTLQSPTPLCLDNLEFG